MKRDANKESGDRPARRDGGTREPVAPRRPKKMKADKRKVAAVKQRRRRPYKVTVVALAACVLLTAGLAATRWEPLRRAAGLQPTVAPAVQQGNLNLSKEYVYAGGRLVATEEPTPQGGPPPTNLLATVTTLATSVGLTWAAPSSGTIANYVIERAQSKDGPFTQVGTSLQSQLFFTDSTAVADTSYLYRVKAAYVSGGSSDYSNTDLATTVVFSDTPLQGVDIKADHLNQVRRAVGAVRALAGLGAAVWTYPDPVSSPGQRRAIYFEDMSELRTNLNPALSALGITQMPEDTTLSRGLAVMAAHIQDVREKVR